MNILFDSPEDARKARTLILPLVRKAVMGEVVGLDTAGGLVVEIPDGEYGGGKILAFCAKADTFPRERLTTARGMRLWFFVKKAQIASDNNRYRVEVALSRNTRTLVEKLIEMECVAAGLASPAPVRCKRRFETERGRVIILGAAEYIPNEILRKVSDMLGGEHIIIKLWRENRRPKE